MQVQGYKKKTKKQLLKAIDESKTITQLCALVQLEGIVIQMRCSNGGYASNLPKKQLQTDDIQQIESPLDRMKRQIREIVEREF